MSLLLILRHHIYRFQGQLSISTNLVYQWRELVRSPECSQA
ncbi:hypothetical protein [Microcoleus sp. AR_TQ3_B6]